MDAYNWKRSLKIVQYVDNTNCAIAEITSAEKPCYKVLETVDLGGHFITWEDLYGTIQAALDAIALEFGKVK